MPGRAIILCGFVFGITLLQPVAMAQQPGAGKEKGMKVEKIEERRSPFVCSLTALDAGERLRHRELSEQLHASVKEVRELKDGYAFRLPAERSAITMAAEWVGLERLCCPFFTFQLEVGEEAAPLWLRITGPKGVKQFMKSEFGLK